jgi:hypothetical protein
MNLEHLPTVVIKVIDPENQRYPTCGDYFYEAHTDTLTIWINKMADWRSELAVAIHELLEAVKCQDDGIALTAIDLFDFQFEKERDEGKHTFADEPGDDPRAPYALAHLAATRVEKEVCAQLQLPWEKHEDNVNES